jgi:hypothetical protein
MYWKHVNTRSSYCVSVVVVYKIWWALVGTVSDFATLLRHSTAKRLLTPGLHVDDSYCMIQKYLTSIPHMVDVWCFFNLKKTILFSLFFLQNYHSGNIESLGWDF